MRSAEEHVTLLEAGIAQHRRNLRDLLTAMFAADGDPDDDPKVRAVLDRIQEQETDE